MKQCHYEAASNSIADVSCFHGEYWLNRINVPAAHRGKGIGSRLLKAILREADQEGITLNLGIVPSGGLSYKQLEAWYKRHGFKKVRNNVYKRVPQTAKENP